MKVQRSNRFLSIVVTIVMVLSMMIVAIPVTVNAAGNIYYVDSVNGIDTNNGTSTSTAWKTLSKVTSTTFVAGDKILLKRGQTFTGMLWPKGSGTSGSPIGIGSYGTGTLPIISAGVNSAAIKLYNQEYWTIDSIETTGGDPYGIFISGDIANNILDYFRITNCVVHNVGGEATTPNDKSNGLIIMAVINGQQFNDVVIDGFDKF